MTEVWGEEMNRALQEKIPWKEYGKPRDVAEAVLFLVSERSRYITGEMLDVNGGLVMDYNAGYDLPDNVRSLADEAVQGIIDGSISIDVSE